jgi:hypothetical protein
LKQYDLILSELKLSEFYNQNMQDILSTNVKELYYEKTRLNEINSFEISYACFEIALTQSIPISINNLINAYNVVNPKSRVPVKDYLDDKIIKLINDYKDQTEIYILIELTQAHHYFDYSPTFNPHKKVWMKHKVVEHIIKKFSD